MAVERELDDGIQILDAPEPIDLSECFNAEDDETWSSEPPEVDPFEQLTWQFNSLSRDFRCEADPPTKVRLSCELRGLFDQIRSTDFNVVKQKRALHKLGRVIREIELDKSIPESIRHKVVELLKDVIK